MLIKADDTVQIMIGDDAGQRGRVLAVDRRTGKIIVEGVNLVYKHVRRSQRNPQGGRLSKEMPIQISNALFVCDKCGRPVRLGTRIEADGAKYRYCRKCGTKISMLSPAKTARKKTSG